jgi:thiol-disulfide isomerase/thioredoxin
LQTIVCVAFAFVALAAFTVSPALAQETEEKQEEKSDDKTQEEEEEEVDPYEIPEMATPAQLVEFIKSVKNIRPTDGEGLRAFRTKAPKAVREASEMIIEDGSDKDAVAFAKEELLMLDIGQLPSLDLDRQKEIYSAIKEKITSAKELTPAEAGMASSVASGLDRSRNPESKELAKTAYTELGEVLAGSDSESIAKMGRRMQGVVRRMDLVGNQIELTGVKVDGSEFDIAELKGKVVLVDFWATWCGPCVAEHPNIKKNYEKYHDKGFEVVGISLDRSREPLEKYLDEHEVKWINLYEEGGTSAAADYYGVMGIPTMMLVDREGKVISITARGPALTKLLGELFGDDEDTEIDQSK